MESQDHYGILGIDHHANGVEIRTAYRRLAQRFHPDVTVDVDGERKFKAVSEAYRTLKARDTRAAYDRQALPGAGDAAIVWLDDPIACWNPMFSWAVWAWFWIR